MEHRTLYCETIFAIINKGLIRGMCNVIFTSRREETRHDISNHQVQFYLGPKNYPTCQALRLLY